MMQNWSSFNQASCSWLWTNQSPLLRFMNCGGNPNHIMYCLKLKTGIGRCNLGFQSIFWECTRLIHYCMAIGSPKTGLENLKMVQALCGRWRTSFGGKTRSTPSASRSSGWSCSSFFYMDLADAKTTFCFYSNWRLQWQQIVTIC